MERRTSELTKKNRYSNTVLRIEVRCIPFDCLYQKKNESFSSLNFFNDFEKFLNYSIFFFHSSPDILESPSKTKICGMLSKAFVHNMHVPTDLPIQI